MVLEVEAEGREKGGVRGEALEAPVHDEALDEQERKVPDDDGDEEPCEGRGDPRQVGDPFLQGEQRPPRIAGTEMRKENFAARRGAIPNRRARTIVEPERDNPGKTASP